ncbi:MAG TPA: AraC family transcriptional regulator, partial [Marinobacter hydrocarbonoclasticus]|nr:AraC family transcriptional regulator [Marinobacter nauticus]
QSGLSVQRVADAVGYSSLSAFSDRFRAHFGKAPSHFRRISK